MRRKGRKEGRRERGIKKFTSPEGRGGGWVKQGMGIKEHLPYTFKRTISIKK